MKLSGQVALVTGAGHRLGRSIALALGEAGADIAVHFRSTRGGAEAVAAELAERGSTGVPIQADLADPAQIDDLVTRVTARFGRLDVLVNSAASFERAPIGEIDAEAWDRVLDVNLRAPFLCTRAALPHLAAPGRGAPGAVVNVSDLSALSPWKGFAHHATSKAGLLHLTRSLARELGPDVRVNAVVPGPILPPEGIDPESPEWQRRGDRLPLHRTGHPAEVGHAVRFLVENDYVTGESVAVDGGERLIAGRGDA